MLLLSSFSSAQRQKNELAFLLGAEQIPATTTTAGSAINFGSSISLSAAYDYRLFGHRTALLLDIPFSAGPSHPVSTSQTGTITSLATLYLVPSLRVRFNTEGLLSPWLSGGIGYGLYEGSRTLAGGTKNPSTLRSSAAAQFGGGLDVRTPLPLLFPISLRAEIRDYHTLNAPDFGVKVQRSSQDNIVAAGGFVVHF